MAILIFLAVPTASRGADSPQSLYTKRARHALERIQSFEENPASSTLNSRDVPEESIDDCPNLDPSDPKFRELKSAQAQLTASYAETLPELLQLKSGLEDALNTDESTRPHFQDLRAKTETAEEKIHILDFDRKEMAAKEQQIKVWEKKKCSAARKKVSEPEEEPPEAAPPSNETDDRIRDAEPPAPDDSEPSDLGPEQSHTP